MKNIGTFAGLFMILLQVNGGFLELQAWLQLDLSSGIPLSGIDSPYSVARMKQS